MLRKILIGLGVFIAILQFPGFPHDVIRWFTMLAGLVIVFLLTIPNKARPEWLETPTGAGAERKITIIRAGEEHEAESAP